MPNPVPNTKSATAFALKVFTPDDAGKYRQIGVLQQLNPSHTRSGTPVGGVGMGDIIGEIVPGRTAYTLAVEYFVLYKRRFFEALGYDASFRMLAELQTPLDIEEQLTPPTDTSNPIITWYRGCVVTDSSNTQRWDTETVISTSATLSCASLDDGVSPIEAALL